MSYPYNKIRFQIEIPCDACGGSGRVSGLAEASNPGSAYEAACDDCEGTGWQTDRISIDELKEILDSGE